MSDRSQRHGLLASLRILVLPANSMGTSAMNKKAFQDYYPDNFSQCYGCGRLNEKGLNIKSYWDGGETVCTFNPDEKYAAYQEWFTAALSHH